MRNFGLFLGLITFLMVSSCDKKVEKTTETIETNTVTTDTVIIKEKAPKEDGTSVKIDSSGIEVNSKKVDVEIK